METIGKFNNSGDIPELTLKGCILVCQADGMWDKTEIESIGTLMDKLDIGDELKSQFEKSILFDETAFFNEIGSLSDTEAKSFLMDAMILFALTDQDLHKREQIFLSKAANAMGLVFDVDTAKRKMKRLFQ